MGMHILFDSAAKNAPDPCGFCLMPGGLCVVRLKKGKGRKAQFPQLDFDNTKCQRNNQVKLSIKAFRKSTKSSPCTNIPINCPLCPSGSNAIWKYNLQDHIASVHPTANVDEYKTLFEIEKAEKVLLKQKWQSKPRWTPRRFRNLGEINISEAHRAVLATRYVNIIGI
jgi:hypothetical protein